MINDKAAEPVTLKCRFSELLDIHAKNQKGPAHWSFNACMNFGQAVHKREHILLPEDRALHFDLEDLDR